MNPELLEVKMFADYVYGSGGEGRDALLDSVLELGGDPVGARRDEPVAALLERAAYRYFDGQEEYADRFLRYVTGVLAAGSAPHDLNVGTEPPFPEDMLRFIIRRSWQATQARRFSRITGTATKPIAPLKTVSPTDRIVARNQPEEVQVNVSWAIVVSTPEGWGDFGNGAADLALNTVEFTLSELGYQGRRYACFKGYCWDQAWRLFGDFMLGFLQIRKPWSEIVIPFPTVRQWVLERASLST
jgi:hypothetical protein